MKKLIVIIFLCNCCLMQAVQNPQFDAFLRDISRQSAQWRGTQTALETSREYQIGDTQVFWSWNLSVMPPLWIQTAATCQAVGEFCYVFVADDQWNVNMDQDDVDLVMNYLENETMNSTEYGAVEMDIELFGPVPDELDNDPKIIVFYMELGSFAGTAFDGYFSAYNQVTEQQAQQMNPPGHSNECEMIYMTCSPLNPTDPIRISVLAHELEHMIHWGQDVNEDTWLDEGCAELAMVHFGIPDPIINFPTNPDNQLNMWNQQFADYVKVMLFFTYLYEQFATDENEFIKDIVADPLNGLPSIANQLAQNGYTIPLEAVFMNWTIANYIDDPNLYQGQYGYEMLELPVFSAAASHNSFPAANTGTVQPWATDYIRVFPNGANIEHTIVTNNSNQSIGVIKKLLAVDEYEVDFIYFNTSWTGNIPPEWADLYHYIVYVYANHSSSLLNYSYNLEEIVSAEDLLPATEIAISNYPNPFNPRTEIRFQVSEIGAAQSAEIVIYNVKGQKVKQLVSDQLAAGQHSVVWNGTDQSNNSVSSGIYIARLKAEKIDVSCKMLLLK